MKPGRFFTVSVALIVAAGQFVLDFHTTLVFHRELSHFQASGTFLGDGLLALAAPLFVLLANPKAKGESLEKLEHIQVRQELSPKEGHL